MTQAKPRFSTFGEYLSYNDGTDNRYELIDGELINLPPEAEPNTAIATYLLLAFVNAGVSYRLIKPYTCEVQVPVLRKGDAQNRYPDLVVLREEHLVLTQKRLTIKLDMPPPQFVAEIVSPGQSNRERDYERKRDQYCRIGIPEYWIIDPSSRTVLVLGLDTSNYVDIGQFRGNESVISLAFPAIALTPEQIFAASV